MATWRVTGIAATGEAYTYRVSAPHAAEQHEIFGAANAEHTRKLAAGEVAEPLGPWAVISEITNTEFDLPHTPPLPLRDC